MRLRVRRSVGRGSGDPPRADAAGRGCYARAVDDDAIDAGREWAGSVRRLLVEEGRAATGGWPGTMTEARARAGQLESPTELSPQERVRLARVLYAAAKENWAVGPAH